MENPNRPFYFNGEHEYAMYEDHIMIKTDPPIVAKKGHTDMCGARFSATLGFCTRKKGHTGAHEQFCGCKRKHLVYRRWQEPLTLKQRDALPRGRLNSNELEK